MRIIDKIFRDKKTNTLIYIILAVGILMIVCANSFATPKSYDADISGQESSFPLESKTEEILSKIEGVGKTDVMISYKGMENEKEISSVLVVASGGENTSVKEKIIRALKAALGIDAHKIEVFERKEAI